MGLSIGIYRFESSTIKKKSLTYKAKAIPRLNLVVKASINLVLRGGVPRDYLKKCDL